MKYLFIITMILALAAILPVIINALKSHKLTGAANTYDAAVETHECAVMRTNDVAITARHLLWTKGATDTGVALATAALPAIGTIDNTESSTAIQQAVLLLGRGPTKKMVASEAIAAGGPVFQAASGKVAATGGICVGVALTAAAADGDIIEVNDCEPMRGGTFAGSGGAVTQATSASTGVTLNKACGQITTVALTTAAAAEERFTVTNSAVIATDVIVLSTTYNGNGTPALAVANVTAGAFDIIVTNLHASAAFNAAMTINFAVIKAVAA